MRLLLSAIIISSLTSCAAYDNITNKSKKKAISVGETALAEGAKHTPSGRKYKSLVFTDRIFVPDLQDNKRNKPDWYFDTWESESSKLSLLQYMSDIQEKTNVNVRYLHQVDETVTFPMFFKGEYGDAIEAMSLATGYSYDIKDNLITWSKFQDKHFDLAFLGGKQNFRLGRDQNTGQGGKNQNSFGSVQVAKTGGFDEENTSYSNTEVKDLSQFEQLKNALDILVSKEGKYVLDEANSILLVRDFPTTVSSIERYINSYKSKATTNILIELKVIEFSNSNGVNNEINWNLVNRTLSDAGVLSLTSAFGTPLVSTSAPALLNYTRTGGQNSGSQIFIQALQSQGTVTTVTEPQILTVSNKMSRVNVGRDQGYAASSGQSVGGVSSVQQDQITPGMLETGTDLYVYPTLDTDTGEVTVQINSRFSDFNEFRTFESGESRIQTPDTNKRQFELTFTAKTGQTMLVTGYKSKRVESQSNFTGADIPVIDLLLGGSKRANEVHAETMLLITPHILGKF